MSKLAQQLTLTTALIVSGGAMAHEQNNDPHYDAHQSNAQNMETMQGRLDKLEQLLEESKTLHKTDNLSAREKRMNLKQELKDDFRAEVKEAGAELKNDNYFSLGVVGIPIAILVLGMAFASGRVARRYLTKDIEGKMKDFNNKIDKAATDFKKEVDERISHVDKRNEEQDAEQQRSKEEQKEANQLSRVRTLTLTFSEFAASNSVLFKNIPKTTDRKEFQRNPDLNYICYLLDYGQAHVEKLQESFPEREQDIDEKDCLDKDKALVTYFLNSYIYYLSARGLDKDIANVWKKIGDFKDMVQEGKREGSEHWHDYAATAIWAELHLNSHKKGAGKQARTEIQDLFAEVDEADLDKNGNWKQGIIKSFKTFDGLFPKNKVDFEINTPKP